LWGLLRPTQDGVRKLVDPPRDTQHNEDRRLALAVLARRAHHRGEVVCGNRVQAVIPEARHEMLLDRVPVAIPSRLSEVHHGTAQPLVGRQSEAQPRILSGGLSLSPPRKQLVPQRSSRQEAALNRAPSLDTAGIPKANLQRSVGAPIDVRFDPNSPRGLPSGTHRPAPANSVCPRRSERRQAFRSLRRKNSLHPGPLCSLAMLRSAARRLRVSR
jgi:hypothetical protein